MFDIAAAAALSLSGHSLATDPLRALLAAATRPSRRLCVCLPYNGVGAVGCTALANPGIWKEFIVA